MIWATVSSWSCFCWLYTASPFLAAKNTINLILVLTIWGCPCVESSLVLLEEGVIHIVKTMGFPVVMYGCESWTIQKAECQRIDAFELWCWRRLLRIPWTARILHQSILKEINCKYSLEGLMLRLKLQYFAHLMWRADSLEKTLMLRKIEGWRRRGQWRNKMVGWHHQLLPTQSTWVWVSSGRWWRTGKPGMLQSMGCQSWKQLSNNNKYQDRKCVTENYQSKQIWTELPS